MEDLPGHETYRIGLSYPDVLHNLEQLLPEKSIKRAEFISSISMPEASRYCVSLIPWRLVDLRMFDFRYSAAIEKAMSALCLMESGGESATTSWKGAWNIAAQCAEPDCLFSSRQHQQLSFSGAVISDETSSAIIGLRWIRRGLCGAARAGISGT